MTDAQSSCGELWARRRTDRPFETLIGFADGLLREPI
jgi:hypothetical protein